MAHRVRAPTPRRGLARRRRRALARPRSFYSYRWWHRRFYWEARRCASPSGREGASHTWSEHHAQPPPSRRGQRELERDARRCHVQPRRHRCARSAMRLCDRFLWGSTFPPVARPRPGPQLGAGRLRSLVRSATRRPGTLGATRAPLGVRAAWWWLALLKCVRRGDTKNIDAGIQLKKKFNPFPPSIAVTVVHDRIRTCQHNTVTEYLNCEYSNYSCRERYRCTFHIERPHGWVV